MDYFPSSRIKSRIKLMNDDCRDIIADENSAAVKDIRRITIGHVRDIIAKYNLRPATFAHIYSDKSGTFCCIVGILAIGKAGSLKDGLGLLYGHGILARKDNGDGVPLGE